MYLCGECCICTNICILFRQTSSLHPREYRTECALLHQKVRKFREGDTLNLKEQIEGDTLNLKEQTGSSWT